MLWSRIGRRLREAGCDEYETKPIDFERLSNKIDSLILDKKLA